MVRKYLVLLLAPIVLIEGCLIDITANSNTADMMIPFSYFVFPFAVILLLLGGVYFLLAKRITENKLEISITNILITYTFYFPALTLFIMLIVEFFQLYQMFRNLSTRPFELLFYGGAWLFLGVQLMAIFMLIYTFVRND